jgi:metal-responsive CopG/Arc/MetJ family transcriptional regulator
MSPEILKEIERHAGGARFRSSFIDAVLRSYLRDRAAAERNARDIEIINQHAEELNAEAEDCLGYQADIEE